MKKILYFLLATCILYACNDSTAATNAKPATPKKVEYRYTIKDSDKSYSDIKSYKRDSTGCITFNYESGGCICGSSEQQVVTVCGSYTITKVEQ